MKFRWYLRVIDICHLRIVPWSKYFLTLNSLANIQFSLISLLWALNASHFSNYLSTISNQLIIACMVLLSLHHTLRPLDVVFLLNDIRQIPPLNKLNPLQVCYLHSLFIGFPSFIKGREFLFKGIQILCGFTLLNIHTSNYIYGKLESSLTNN